MGSVGALEGGGGGARSAEGLQSMLLLLRALKSMTQRHNPDAFFQLNGQPDTGLQLASPLRYPAHTPN